MKSSQWVRNAVKSINRKRDSRLWLSLRLRNKSHSWKSQKLRKDPLLLTSQKSLQSMELLRLKLSKSLSNFCQNSSGKSRNQLWNKPRPKVKSNQNPKSNSHRRSFTHMSLVINAEWVKSRESDINVQFVLTSTSAKSAKLPAPMITLSSRSSIQGMHPLRSTLSWRKTGKTDLKLMGKMFHLTDSLLSKIFMRLSSVQVKKVNNHRKVSEFQASSKDIARSRKRSITNAIKRTNFLNNQKLNRRAKKLNKKSQLSLSLCRRQRTRSNRLGLSRRRNKSSLRTWCRTHHTSHQSWTSTTTDATSLLWSTHIRRRKSFWSFISRTQVNLSE